MLGSGKLSKALTVKAAAFSESAKAAIEAAGGTIELIPQQAKWTRKAYKKAKAANPEYEADKLKKKVASLIAKVGAHGKALGPGHGSAGTLVTCLRC